MIQHYSLLFIDYYLIMPVIITKLLTVIAASLFIEGHVGVKRKGDTSQ